MARNWGRSAGSSNEKREKEPKQYSSTFPAACHSLTATEFKFDSAIKY